MVPGTILLKSFRHGRPGSDLASKYMVFATFPTPQLVGHSFPEGTFLNSLVSLGFHYDSPLSGPIQSDGWHPGSGDSPPYLVLSKMKVASRSKCIEPRSCKRGPGRTRTIPLNMCQRPVSPIDFCRRLLPCSSPLFGPIQSEGGHPGSSIAGMLCFVAVGHFRGVRFAADPGAP